MWVQRIPANEKSDAIAFEAVTSATTYYIDKIPTKHLINKAQKQILSTWKNHWDSILNNKLRNVKKQY